MTSYSLTSTNGGQIPCAMLSPQATARPSPTRDRMVARGNLVGAVAYAVVAEGLTNGKRTDTESEAEG
jgi:hypothetical protein